MVNPRKIELLAPAANKHIAKQAILHGADAVYLGATSHGARKAASNSIEDIAEVVDFAHQYRAKVYVTVNTIIYDRELKQVETLCRDLYKARVDALIVQDMAMLRLDLPPIALHASTQCDIRTPEKARFLQEVGFSQLVLARELTIPEIQSIVKSVDIPVECFIHGALCVSYSGRCHASCVATGRSANRGECAQICRLPYLLRDKAGRIISEDKHLLSLRDFNASHIIDRLIENGVSSFKIEGRLKEEDYVKNVVSFYNKRINELIKSRPNEYIRSSSGTSVCSFDPKLDKSFNRGFTTYFLESRRPASIASLLTPKSMGEVVNVSDLNNGDGISFFDHNNCYNGVNINRVENGKIITNKKINIPKGAIIHRTSDIEWQKLMRKDSAIRKITLKIDVDPTGITARDERGVEIRLPLDVKQDIAIKPMDIEREFAKLGNTVYSLVSFKSTLGADIFIPRSEISKLRRKMVYMLDMANLATYHFDMRRAENREFKFPAKILDYRDNVANSIAAAFYKEHGVTEIEYAIEERKKELEKGTVVMTTRYCILRELGLCKRNKPHGNFQLKRGEQSNIKYEEPLTLINGKISWNLRFNCNICEMEVLSR